MSPQETATVLVVDDEEMVADMFSMQLERSFDARTAYGGEAALDAIDGDVDVVLLDRRMPDKSGDEVLAAIRERGLDCRVIMVTAVDADFDILDMPCDAYIEKPVSGDALRETVQCQVDLTSYDERVSELYAIASKLTALEAEKPALELDRNEAYREARNRRDALQNEMDDLEAELDAFQLI